MIFRVPSYRCRWRDAPPPPPFRVPPLYHYTMNCCPVTLLTPTVCHTIVYCCCTILDSALILPAQILPLFNARCPAYVDLYARTPKLQGTWTVYVVVRRDAAERGKGKGRGSGEFALRSSKNLSILPPNVVRGCRRRRCCWPLL